MNNRGEAFNRRRFLRHNTMGIGGLSLGWLLNRDKLLATPPAVPRGEQSFDLTPKQPHHTPKAKAMISLFMHGGPSHMDLTDPKPDATCSAARGNSRNTASAGWISASCCRTRPASPMTFA